MKILLDLDGVLVDLVKGLSQVHQRPCPYEAGARGEYEVWKLYGMLWHELWMPCHNESFWAHLPWTVDGKEILQLLESKFKPENICILTRPIPSGACMVGKMMWIERNLPDYFDNERYLIGGAKHFLASPSKLLIDDYDRNFDMFLQGGGKAILLPRPWNRNHELNTIDHLKEKLNQHHNLIKESNAS